jgi:uncharacterized protein YeaO (DUF488 family)
VGNSFPTTQASRRQPSALKIKRVYEEAGREDGFRILVDRLWPRGLAKERAAVDLWLKEIAPSDDLRKWYGHEPEKWPGFKKRYFSELRGHRELVETIMTKARKGPLTLLFGSKEERYNNAVALKEFIEGELSGKPAAL